MNVELTTGKTSHSPKLYRRLRRHIQASQIRFAGKHVIVAVSGGIDSMVLLDMLSELSREKKIRLSVAHVNHTLRGKESAADEQFVKRTSRKLGIPFFCERVRTLRLARRSKTSIQEAARQARYAFFGRLKKRLSADLIVTAHTASDNAETMMLNFFRGSGVEGMAGIPVFRKNDGIVRPLLFASREEIAEYAHERKLLFREDSSNAKIEYSRNFLRHRIIPQIVEKINPALVQTLRSEAALFRLCSEYVDSVVVPAIKELADVRTSEAQITVRPLVKHHPFLQQMMVKKILSTLNIEPNSVRIASVLQLVRQQKGTTIDLGGGWRAERTAPTVVLTNEVDHEPLAYTLTKPGVLKTDLFSLSVKASKIPANKIGRRSSTEYVDRAFVTFPLTIRSWRNGDRFRPIGMRGMKKVSDFFVDAKVPRSEKQKIPIVLSSGRIVWIAGHRLDDRCKVTESTKQCYQMNISFKS